jgi:hypothetical protein
MNRKSREIMCLQRLQETTNQLGDILVFLKQENLIDEQKIKAIATSPEYPKELQGILRDLQVRQKFQLLEFEWNLLPVENIRIYIVTDRNQKEFVYNG